MTERLHLAEFLPYLMSVTSNRVSERISSTYEALFGLTIPEWRLVTLIAEHAPVTQAQLCERSRMDKVTVSRAAIALSERGLLTRTPNVTDRRSHHLRLSASGEALYAQVAPQAIAQERRIFGRFSAEDLAHFTDMLRRIDAAAEEED
ncbi:MarR family winged helix-turn-helix transcriptional regulator [Sphingomonas endophytica]|uniref:MarR family transcriptional regulator n=1 Tax=Sphingomonas endophytica TaxID=869719 RepID=A0A147I1M2_9SPHN|nr:MarR family transcriptional regulator [Sphingomonas endophytica]KTT71396.1 MarR family transcriptional regulator [Sphingomonas endophytica]